ncbi:glycosyltransferase [Litchfieldia alkalitelluris]|uniref:glycosyltransferase n=1 Tax=Litchfieldia alkalitelluris TaxID=304268 RepID=UPI000996D5BF|nr:glycosyltransferase [Litchfieldia alkalitelluris]
MKKKVLVSMYSLHIGGAERSLIGLLEAFDPSEYEVDLFLYRHEGEFLDYIPKYINLLPQVKEYTTFERPIKTILKEGHLILTSARVLAKVKAARYNKGLKNEQRTYKQMQYTWCYSIPFLPKLKKEYDVALSFLGPHYFILEKVKAKVKIGWVHTDYSTVVYPDRQLDEKMWNNLDYIVNVSKDCENSFLKVFPRLKKKCIIIENIISPAFVRRQANQKIEETEIYNDSTIKICSVGRFSHQKGFDLAVKACNSLVKLGYNIKWYIVGYGVEEETVRKLIKEYQLEDRFILLGKRINPYPYINDCDIYCQPSRYEGKAVTVREAQILGKAVLITQYPTATSQIVNKVDGLITPLGVDGIVNGLIDLIEDKDLYLSIIKNTRDREYGNTLEINKIYELINKINIINSENNKEVI